MPIGRNLLPGKYIWRRLVYAIQEIPKPPSLQVPPQPPPVLRHRQSWMERGFLVPLFHPIGPSHHQNPPLQIYCLLIFSLVRFFVGWEGGANKDLDRERQTQTKKSEATKNLHDGEREEGKQRMAILRKEMWNAGSQCGSPSFLTVDYQWWNFYDIIVNGKALWMSLSLVILATKSLGANFADVGGEKAHRISMQKLLHFRQR